MVKKEQKIEGMLYYLGNLCKQKEEFMCKEEMQMYEEGTNLSKEIRSILVNLPFIQCQILLNDFLVPINEEWWRGIYSKSYYEEQKNIALETFYRCLNN